jgi:hypothetical protein
MDLPNSVAMGCLLNGIDRMCPRVALVFSMMKRLDFLGVCGLLVLNSMTSAALANGTPFFFPNSRGDANSPNALVYTGNIKDTQGRYVDNVQVLVIATDLGMTVPVRNDRPGHYRTPDVHGWIENLGGKVNPEKIRIDIQKPGYILARPVAVPRRTIGTHSVDIVVKSIGQP